MSTDPIKLEWDNAVATILGDAHAPGVIRVAGPVGSGKSTLARRLIDHAGGVLLSTDDYLPDYSSTKEHLRDEPESSHLDELAGHVEQMARGEPTHIPTWSFHEHRRIGSRMVQRGAIDRIIVIEGIHALHSTLARISSIGVFVDATRATRWARWEAIESSGQRGWGVEKARAYFDSVAEPTFEKYRSGYTAEADYVVMNNHSICGDT